MSDLKLRLWKRLSLPIAVRDRCKRFDEDCRFYLFLFYIC